MTKSQAAKRSIRYWEECVREYDKVAPQWLRYRSGDGCGYCERHDGVCDNCPLQSCMMTPFADYLKATTDLEYLEAAMSMLMFLYYAWEEL